MKKLNDIRDLPDDFIICAIDVVRLYPNIKCKEGLEAIRKALDKREDETILFLCCCTASATDILHKMLLSRLPWSQQFHLEVCRPSHWGSKHRLTQSICLNHTVLSKRYQAAVSIYVLRSYGTLYLWNQVEQGSKFNSYIYTLTPISYPLGHRRSQWLLVYKRIYLLFIIL